MNNIDDFIIWWQGFRDGLDPANITKEHLDIIERKINGLQSLYDLVLPEQEYDDSPWSPVFPNPPVWPSIWKEPPIVPYIKPYTEIWCGGLPHVGTPLNPPKVGTPEKQPRGGYPDPVWNN